MDIVKLNESIEGHSITGNSRDPLINRGRDEYKTKNNNNEAVSIRCHRYTAEFNVKSCIDKELNNSEIPMEITSYKKSEIIIKCDKANVYTVKPRCSSKVIKGASGTHGATQWNFPQHTLVKISAVHTEIKRAIEKRELLSSK